MMYPEIYIEFSLVFDNDFDVNEITKLTGIIPNECKCRKENKISPLTNELIEAYWTIKSSIHKCFDVKIAITDIMLKIEQNIQTFIDICNIHNGEAVFCIVLIFEANNKPALYFDRDFLLVVEKLNATIETDMYII